MSRWGAGEGVEGIEALDAHIGGAHYRDESRTSHDDRLTVDDEEPDIGRALRRRKYTPPPGNSKTISETLMKSAKPIKFG